MPEDLIIGEVAWVLISTRMWYSARPNQEKLVLVNVVAGTSKVARERDGTDDWLDHSLSIQYVSALDSSSEKYYIDLTDNTGGRTSAPAALQRRHSRRENGR